MKLNKEAAEYLSRQRWCNFKEEIRQNKVQDISFESLPFDNGNKLLVLGKITLSSSLKNSEDRYFLMPLARLQEPSDTPSLTIGNIAYTDALQQEDYWKSMMKLFAQSDNSITFPNGWQLHYVNTGMPEVIEANKEASSRPLGVEQSNTTLAVGDDTIAFKLERMLAFSHHINPEFEMNEKLMRENCEVMPKTYGYFILKDHNGKTASAGIIQEFVKNDGDLWNYSLAYLKDKLSSGYLQQRQLTAEDNPHFMDLMHNLSRKTAQMEQCLSRADENSGFTPEPVNDSFIHMYQKQMQVLLYQTHKNIAENLEGLPTTTKEKTSYLLENWKQLTTDFINRHLSQISTQDDKGKITRVHGDFHLGQVMVTKDKDLRFIDFAGEPGLPIEQRRQKHINVRDIAGMYRSIKGYLGAVAVEEFVAEAPDAISQKARRDYAQTAIAPLINEAAHTFLGHHSLKEPWLQLEILRKNLYEVNYEVSNRPQMAYVAVNGLSELLQSNPKEQQKFQQKSR